MAIQSLQSLTETDEAVFAIDRTDRIILWNRGCERLFGLAAADAIGKPCHQVIGGYDLHDNLHCYPNCPVIYQTRRLPGNAVGDFPLCARTASQGRRVIYVSTLLVPARYPLPPTIVHIARERPPANHNSSGRARTNESRLTEREQEVLRCLAHGMSTFGVARELSISPTTVRNHVQNLLQKLNVHTKLAAVALAYREGLI